MFASIRECCIGLALDAPLGIEHEYERGSASNLDKCVGVCSLVNKIASIVPIFTIYHSMHYYRDDNTIWGWGEAPSYHSLIAMICYILAAQRPRILLADFVERNSADIRILNVAILRCLSLRKKEAVCIAIHTYRRNFRKIFRRIFRIILRKFCDSSGNTAIDIMCIT